MVCIVEFDGGLRFNFTQNKCKQKLWIEILLKYSKTEIGHLAQLLDLSYQQLVQVHLGNFYLEKESAERLGQLFLLAVSD